MRRPLALAALLAAAVATALFVLDGGEGSLDRIGIVDADGVAEIAGGDELARGAGGSNGERATPRLAAAGSATNARAAGDEAFAPWPTDGIDVVVLDRATREPVPGAIVTFVDPRAHTPGDRAADEHLRRRSWRELFEDRGTRISCDELGRARVPWLVWELVAEDGERRGMRDLWSGVDEPVEVLIAPRDEVRVSVRTEDGAPVAGIGVLYHDWGRRVLLDRRVTDEHGIARFVRTRLDGHAERFGPSAQNFAPEGLFADVHDAMVRAPDRDFPSDVELVVPPHGSVVLEVSDEAVIGAREVVGIAHFTRTQALARERNPRRVEALVRSLRHGDVRFDFVGVGRDLRVLLDESGERRIDLVFDGPSVQDEVVKVPLGSPRPEPRLLARVVDEHGRPIARTRLTVVPLGEVAGRSLLERSVLTDGEGRFAMPLPAIGWYGGAILLHDPNANGRSRPVPFEKLDDRDEVDLGDVVLERELSVVRGRVLGSGGPGANGGLDGARVTVAYVLADDARPKGGAYQMHRILAHTLRDEFDFAVEPGETVAEDRALYTNADGSFEFVAPPGARAALVSVSHRSYRSGSELVTLSGDVDVELSVEPRYVLSGRVVSLEPESFRNADVELVTPRPARSDSRIGGADASPFEPVALDGDSFSIERSTPDAIELLLVTDSVSPVVVARIGAFEPTLAPAAHHPELDPLVLGDHGDRLTLELVQPSGEEWTGSERVVVRGASGTVWFDRWSDSFESNRFAIVGPAGWREPLEVRVSGYRTAEVEPHGTHVRVELERGPMLVVELESVGGIDPRTLDRLTLATGGRTHAFGPGDDGRARFQLSDPGPAQVYVFVDRTDKAESVVDDRVVVITPGVIEWPPARAPGDLAVVVLAEFDVPEEGLATSIHVPSRERLLEMADEQRGER